LHRAFIDTSVLLRYLVRDDDIKATACENLFRESKRKGIALHLLTVAVMEIVWVLEKVYKFDRKDVREVAEAILNTPELKVEMESVFRKALAVYTEKNVKFADAVMGFWGLERGIATVYSYDEKDFKRIEGLEVKIP
jgi:predicted nucleic-acid-binding protein